MNDPGTILYLNGTSSAGRTSLADALKEQPEPSAFKTKRALFTKEPEAP